MKSGWSKSTTKHPIIIILITEEPSIAKPLRLSMETQTSGCWPCPQQPAPLNQDVIRNRIRTWDHVPLTGTIRPNIHLDHLGLPWWANILFLLLTPIVWSIFVSCFPFFYFPLSIFSTLFSSRSCKFYLSKKILNLGSF